MGKASGLVMLARAFGWNVPASWGEAQRLNEDIRPPVAKDRYKRKSNRRRLKRERDRKAIAKGVAAAIRQKQVMRRSWHAYNREMKLNP